MTEPSPATAAPPDRSALRHAASVVVLRHDLPGGPAVLMGQRGASAAFMPSKYVFPGGAVDPQDATVPLWQPLPAALSAALSQMPCPGGTPPVTPEALAAAALRELWEETGLILGHPSDWPAAVPGDWAGFAARGYRPDAQALRFVFRAITPTGRPRRFDARFFMVEAAALRGDPDDFSQACDELSHLHWVPLDQARDLNLPFVTEVVLSEVAALCRGSSAPGVPFFDNTGPRSRFSRL
ncbi:NUDIX hydrolase [Phaeovulum sp. W22_SRMD_FR3]|uniref:NUDIX hydrolase n=1 Tax=Phaeovulum sp. W22_SRMD_FR3 TaxID=3240274 RepID=UPI003F9C5F68